MHRLTSDTTDRARISRIAATAVATAVIGGMLAVSAPSAGATPTSGTITAWGDNRDGQTDVPAAAQSNVKQIAAGQYYALALKTDGSVIGWGENDSGQTTIPAAAQSSVIAIDTEGGNVLARKSDGSLVGWGGGTAPPTGLTGITQIAATRDGGMALKSDHTIQTWGPAALTLDEIPVAVQGHAVSIAAGNTVGLAVTDTGSVAAWGTVAFGQNIVPDAAKSGVVKVVAMDSSIAALKSDGSVVTWGGPTKVGATPAAAMSGVADVAIGYDSAVALKSDGSLVAWGPGNTHGQQNIPAEASYQATSVVEGGYFAMTLHQPWSAPVFGSNNPPGTEVNAAYNYSVNITGTPTPTLSVTDGALPPGLSIDNTTHSIRGTATTTGTYGFTLKADNGHGTPATQAMSITVSPQSWSAPAFGSNNPPGTEVNAAYNYSVNVSGTPTPTLSVAAGALPPGLSLDNTTHSIHGTATTTGTYGFTLKADNGHGTPPTQAMSITVSPQTSPPVFYGDNPPNTEVNAAYNYSVNVGGTPMPTLSVATGALPPGLSIDNTGGHWIRGSASTTGVYHFTLAADNGHGTPATQAMTMTVYQSPWITNGPGWGVLNTPYSSQLTGTGYPTPTYSLASGALPPGLTLSSTGLVSGTPTAAGHYTVNVRLANDFAAVTLPFQIDIRSQATITGTPTAAVVGTAYDYGYTLGGYPQPSTTLLSGTLPDGLSLSSAGRLTGTPTKAGAFTFTVKAHNTSASDFTSDAQVTSTITVQPGHSTGLQFIDPPASVATGAFESDQYVRSFAERYNQTLTSDLTVGGTTVPAGTRVNVYYVHDDHVGSDNVAHTLTGSEWFGTKVLATATSTADLQATTAVFGVPGTTYSTSADQGLEFDDSVTKYVDQTGVNYTLNSWSASDAVRIITLAP
jgi:hypothetical protein